ncbi:hypothetical protein [Shimia sp.]|uniref:hypothetical protein n=1 Tax=Shimia sp. TaxID=1954381 RepID=UPI003298A347
MNRPVTQKITTCTICPHTGAPCQPGYEIARRLCRSILAGGDMIPEDFEISGHVDMVGCLRPCTGAFHATKAACHLFGDVVEGADIDALLASDPAAAITLEAGGSRLS